MALTDLTRISTSGIATGSTIDAAILRKDVSFRGSQIGVTSALFDSSDDALEFNDNVKLKFGNSGDLNLFHNASDSVISHSGAATGSLKILSGGTQSIECLKAGAVELAHNGNKKIETTQTGAVVTGVLTATTFSGNLVGGGSGISTFYDLRVTNNLTVEGTTSTLDTTLIGVDRVEVGANSNSIVGVAVTQGGTADIVRLFDGASPVVTVNGVGRVGINTTTPRSMLDVKDTIHAGRAIHFDNSAWTGEVAGKIQLQSNFLHIMGGTNGVLFRNLTDGNVWEIDSHLSPVTDGKVNIGYSNRKVKTIYSDQVGIADTIFHVGDTDTKIRFPAADQIQLETGGSSRVNLTNDRFQILNRLLTSGDYNYLSGTSTTTATLTLKKSASGADSIDYLQLRDNSNALLFKISGEGILYTSDVLASHEGDTNTKIRFPANDTVSVETAGTEKLRITSSGIIGAGGIPIAASASNGVGNAGTFQFYHVNTSGNNAAAGKIQSIATGAFSGSTSTWDADLVFSSVLNSTETERLRITSDGDVGISSTSPRARLDVKDAHTGHPVILRVSADNATPYALVVGNDDHNTTANRGLGMWVGGSKTHHIQARTSTTISENKLEIEAYETTIQSGTSMNQNFVFDSSGRLLMQGAASTNAFSGGDDLIIGSTSARSGITLVSSGSNDGGLYFSKGTSSNSDHVMGQIVYQHDNNGGYLRLYTNAGEKVRIDASGRLLVGSAAMQYHNAPFYASGTGPVIGAFHSSSGGTNDQARIALGALANNPPYNRGVYLTAENNGAGHDFIVACSASHSTGPSEKVRIKSGGNVGINETSPDSLLHVSTNSSTAYSMSTVNTVNSTNALLRLENTNGSDGSGVDNYVGVYFRVANGANSDAQLQYVREGDNKGAFHFKARNTGTSYPNLMTMKSDGNIGVGVTNPKSKLHLGSVGDIRFGSQYGGFAHINQQVQYSAGYTGTHWQFESNSSISWCFDGVIIVYGSGGSTYGSEVTKITIVYSRENGANNSGDIWRNGTTSYNVETLGHGQVGLSPGSGDLTVAEDTAPDGAASTRSLFKLGWSSASTGGSTNTWSKLHGTLYWGQGVGYGSVEVQDKDGNIFWNSNP